MADTSNEGVPQGTTGAKKEARNKKVKWSVRREGVLGSPKLTIKTAVVRSDGSPRTSSEGLYYIAVYSASPEDRIGMIRQGVPASDAKRIVKDLGVEQKFFYQALGFKTATVNRKAKSNDLLSSHESERLLGVAKLVGQLGMMVAESGDPEEFDATEWISNWLREPLPALGGERPINFLDTMEGQTLVSDLLARIQSGAYA